MNFATETNSSILRNYFYIQRARLEMNRRELAIKSNEWRSRMSRAQAFKAWCASNRGATIAEMIAQGVRLGGRL